MCISGKLITRTLDLISELERIQPILTPTYKKEFNMKSIDLVGYIAATLTTAAFLPQVLKVWQSKSTKDLALPTLLSFIAGVAMWLVYGLLVKSTPIIMANSVTLVLNLVILHFKLKHG
jgi:MtN3 and saliva related transmembrane protein